MISFFRKPLEAPKGILTTDMHSHLLAALDDGVKTHEEAIEIILRFEQLGYRKIITTPHIMSDYYRNEPGNIKQRLGELNEVIKQKSISTKVEAAAEYYLDEELMRKLSQKEELLTMGDNYLLFETNFFTEPYQLNEFIFAALTQGYRPILAHPERYQFMTLEKAEELRDRGVKLQLNATSLIGAYGKPVTKMAEKLVEKGWVDLIGSDCHNTMHATALREVYRNKFFAKALDLPLLNNFL